MRLLSDRMRLRTVAATLTLCTLLGACAVRVLLALHVPGGRWHVDGVFGSADEEEVATDACRVLMALSVVL